MADILGGFFIDVIDVTNGVSTRTNSDGVTTFAAVTSVRGRRGDDVIELTDSTVTGIVNGGAGRDTVTVSGSSIGHINLSRGNDTLDFSDTNITGTDGISGSSGTDSLNLPAGIIITDVIHGEITVTGTGGYNLSSGSFVLPTGQSVDYTEFEAGIEFPCFVRGALIDTPTGHRRVEDLKVGDLVLIEQHGPQQIRWVGQRKLGSADIESNPKLRPVRIVANALGGGLPKRDLQVSRQHRMLVQSKIAERMFGRCDVLISAIKLTELPGIFVDNSIKEVEYFHLLF